MKLPARWSVALVGGVLVVAMLAALALVLPALAQGPRGGQWRGWGMHGPGMMGGWGGQAACPLYGSGGWLGGGPLSQAKVEPLTVAQTLEAVKGYLAGLGRNDLAVDEVMVFDNHSYARVVETGTGIGAMELLVDPRTLGVYPEMGPNMMWNQKYGMHGGMGGMMGWGWFGRSADPTNMDVTPEEAVQVAQAYLDQEYEGRYQVEDEANPFYGYYTIDIDEGDRAVGMLSVNGYTGDVFVHTWHGEFVAAEHGLAGPHE